MMRDVAELDGVTDSLKFGKFLVACAALIAEPVNYSKKEGGRAEGRGMV